MPAFSGVDLVITLDAGVTSVNVQDVYEAWKDWLLSSPVNRAYPQAFRSDGGAPLSSIINQGSYFFLNNSAGWRIKPPEEDTTIYLTGNLAVEDTDLPAFVPTDGDYTAAILGLQPVTQGVTPAMAQQLRHTSFNGGVWIDVVNGGTLESIGDEAGTERFPVNNFADGLTIQQAEGFNTFFVIGDCTVDSGLTYNNVVFVGQGQNLSTVTLAAAANITNCTFEEARITGTLDGECHVIDCIIDEVDFISGVIERCILNPGTISLGGGAIAHFLDCRSGVPGEGAPVIDFGGSGQALALRNYNGGIKLENKTGADAVSIDLSSGQIILSDTTITAGTIVCRGVGKVIDESGDRVPSGLRNGATIVNETIDSRDLLLTRKLLSNKVIISADDTTTNIYDDDGVTLLWSFTHGSPRDRTPV